MVTAYSGMKIIKGDENEPIPEGVILVEDGEIKLVDQYSNIEIPADAEIVDLTGKVVMPGIIDCHIHSLMDASPDPISEVMQQPDAMSVLRGADHLRATVESGVTYVRDLGGVNYAEMSLQQASDEGLIQGPRMQVCGRVITMTGGHGHPMGREADAEDEVRKAAREQLKAGADIIKLMATGGVLTPGVEPGASQLSEKEMRAAVEEAGNAGKRTAAHAQGAEGIKNALRAGVDSIEHGLFLDEEAVQLMKEKDAWLVPTLAATHWIIQAGTEGGIPPYAVKKAEDAQKSHRKSFQMALEAGVKIAMGTDAGTPFNQHGENIQELELMVRAGMNPLEAIRSATSQAAKLLGVSDHVGTISAGKRADLLVLDDDPLADIQNMYHVNRVYKDGKLMY